MVLAVGLVFGFFFFNILGSALGLYYEQRKGAH